MLGLVYRYLIFHVLNYIYADLRDDKQFFIDHPGAVPITAAQVKIAMKNHFFFSCSTFEFMDEREGVCFFSFPFFLINLRLILIILLGFPGRGAKENDWCTCLH